MKCQIYLSISDPPPNFLIAKQAFSSRPFHPVSAHSTQSYILRLRMERAKELLATTNQSVSDVAM
jgi:AraC-like DNA-binding protein